VCCVITGHIQQLYDYSELLHHSATASAKQRSGLILLPTLYTLNYSIAMATAGEVSFSVVLLTGRWLLSRPDDTFTETTQGS